MVAVHDPEVALQGSGEDVSPVDLLRLLGRSGRTGLIEFVGRSHATVGMVHGLLTFVRSASAPSLRQSLLARGVVTEDQWELASLGGGSDVLDALAHNGDCDPAQLRAALREQIVNGLFEVQLNCHDRFRFLARENQPVPSRLSYPVEPLLDEAEQRLVRWDTLQTRLASSDVAPRRLPRLAPAVGSITLDDTQWRIVAALDGSLDLTALTSTLGLSLYQLAEALDQLVDLGVVSLD